MTDKIQILETKNFIEDHAVDPAENPPHVLIVMHGIRDNSAWSQNYRKTIEEGGVTDVVIQPVSYDLLDTFSFVFGSRDDEIDDDVFSDISDIRQKFPLSPLSVVAHSNGTKVLARVVRQFEFDFENVFLLGSICRLRDAKRFTRVKKLVVNDCAARDYWPSIAKALRPRKFGDTGVVGFSSHKIIDRYFDYNHTEGTSEEHFKNWIYPAITSGNPQIPKYIDLGIRKHYPNMIRAIGVIILGFFLICCAYFL